MKKLAAVAALAVAIPAAAYVVPPSQVVRRFAETEAFDHVTPGLLIGRAHVDGAPTDVSARLDLTKTGCTAQLDLDSGQAVVKFADGRVSSEGGALPALEAFAALACPLITLHDVPADEAEKLVQTFAKSLGVDYAVSSLSQLDGRVAMVVGAHPRQPQRPQIWFDKTTNRPMRIIASHGGKMWDVRLVDASSIATNRLAPRQIAVWQGAQQHLAVRWMAANPKAPIDGTPAETEDEGED